MKIYEPKDMVNIAACLVIIAIVGVMLAIKPVPSIEPLSYSGDPVAREIGIARGNAMVIARRGK